MYFCLNSFIKNQKRKIKVFSGKRNSLIKDCLLGKLAVPLMDVGVSFAEKFLSPLTTMSKVSAIDGAIQRNICGKAVVKAGNKSP